MASIPFAAKALVGHVPELALVPTKPITLQEIVDDFCQQLDNAPQLIANIMQSGGTSVVIHCHTERNAEILLNAGLCFRGHPLKLLPAPSIQWVKLTRVVYGTTENAVKSRMTEYGTVLKIKRETINGIGISVYSVKMDLKRPIPSRITIAHYPVNVFYRGQVQQCFRCEQTGHISRNCPQKKSGTQDLPTFDGPTEMNVEDAPSSDTINGIPVPPTDQSESSTDATPRNEETGKRQLKDKDVPQTKQARVEDPIADSSNDSPVSYETFERENVRIGCIKNLSETETSSFKELLERIPPKDKSSFCPTYAYRHPLLVPEESSSLKEWAFTAITKDNPPDDILDLSSTSLMQPILPEAAKDKPRIVDYPLFERLQAWAILAKATNSVTPPPPSVVTVMKQMDKAVMAGYLNHFFYTHPEYMEYTSLIDDQRKQLLLSLVKLKEKISYV